MNITNDVLIALRRIIRATDLYSKQLYRSSGLTMAQILLLQAIRNRPGAPIGDLANEIQLSQATVTTILDRLETRQLITRERSGSDKRKVSVSLTATGIELIENAPVPLQEHFVNKFIQLQDWEQSLILSSLQRVAQMMDAESLDASPILDIEVPGKMDTD